MKIIGKSGNAYLILTSVIGENQNGRVLDLDANELTIEQPLQRYYKFNAWEPYNAKPGELERMLAGVKNIKD
jgi:hypothetical protein